MTSQQLSKSPLAPQGNVQILGILLCMHHFVTIVRPELQQDLMTTWTQFQTYPINYMNNFNFEHRQKLYMLYMLSEGGMYQFSILCCGITIIAIVINRPNRKMSNLTQSLALLVYRALK